MEVPAVDARIEHVTVYARGALIRRVVTIPAPLPDRVRIVGLPRSVIDHTLRVEVGGPAIATAVRSGVDAPAGATALEETTELRGARRRVAIADAEVARIAEAIDVLDTAAVVEADPSDDPPAAWAAVVAARRALIAVRRERELALHTGLAAARRESEEAQRAFVAIADRERRTGSAGPAKPHELRTYVEIDLTATAASEIAIHLEYQIAAARWAPSYIARIDGDEVAVEIRAVVAQDAGEDWSAVPLRLSTAEPSQFSLLPELAAQKIGRRQHEPGRAGFRAAPTGAAALYADYDRSRRRDALLPAPESTRADEPAESDELADQVWDEESSRAKVAFQTPPEGRRLPPPAPLFAAAPGGAPPAAAKKQMRSRSADLRIGGAGGEARSEPAAVSLAPVPRLDYGNLVMAPPSSPARGTLIAAPVDRRRTSIAGEQAHAQARISALRLPPGHVDAWAQGFDYAFATDAAVDVAADGAWHAIAVSARTTTTKLRHVAVPREQADVFRVASIANPFAGPLLPGPIDVYDHGRFLVTSSVELTPPGATVEIGLGVDPAVKIARNAEFREESAGMLRGKLELHHVIAIDVENVSGRSIDLEVRERVPVKRDGDDEVEVVLGRIEPGWERWTPDPEAPRDQRLRGGYRWRLTVPAGAKRTLKASYEIKLAGKHELVGGNRREP